jgi:hypothetical protein
MSTAVANCTVILTAAIRCRCQETLVKIAVLTPILSRLSVVKSTRFKRYLIRSQSLFALIAMLGILLIGSGARADSQVSIYLYGADNTILNVTNVYSFHDNHLFDPSGYSMGVGNNQSQIVNEYNVVIGYFVGSVIVIP